jgi:hypothetical protein
MKCHNALTYLFIHTHIHAGLVNGDVSWIWNFEDAVDNDKNQPELSDEEGEEENEDSSTANGARNGNE